MMRAIASRTAAERAARDRMDLIKAQNILRAEGQPKAAQAIEPTLIMLTQAVDEWYRSRAAR